VTFRDHISHDQQKQNGWYASKWNLLYYDKKKLEFFFAFEIIHVLLSLSLDKAEHFGKGFLGHFGEVLRNNTKKRKNAAQL
jgi:hypothetical protein